MSFDELLHRFGPEVQLRQLHIARYPDIASGGWDVDLVSGSLRFRQSGRTCRIQIVGTEANGVWMWAWANPSFAPALVEAAASIQAWARERDEPELSERALRLPPWTPGEVLSGMSCTAIAAGLLDAPGIYCCHDRATDRRLYVVLLDDTLRAPPPENPLERIALGLPQVLALAGRHPYEGGITLTDWVLALDGLCRSYGVDGEMDGDDVLLRHGDRTARASMKKGSLTIEATL